MDASGVVDGVCLWNGCLDLVGADQAGTWVNPNSITGWAANASLNTYGGWYGRFEAVGGNIIPATPPSTPTNAIGVPGATCELRFAPPVDDGGSPIRSVTLPPTGATETGTAIWAALFVLAGASALLVARRRTST